MNAKTLQTAFLLLCLALVLVLGFLVLAPFLTVLAVAAMAAVVSYPFHARLTQLLRGRAGISAFLTVLTVVALFLVPLSFLATRVITEAVDLYGAITANRAEYLDTIERAIVEPVRAIFPNATIDTEPYVQQGLRWITSNLGSVFSGTVEVLLDFFLFLIAFFFFLKDGRQFAKTFMSLSPLSDRYDQDVFDRMALAINSMMRGQLFVALVQGTLTGVGFAIFGIPNPALWGSVAALCALIPGLGTSLIIVPGVIFLFATGKPWNATGLLIWGATAVGLIDNFLGPILVGRGARIHPVLVLFAVLGGLAFYGPMGFLLGPLTISLLFALLDLYRLFILKQRAVLTQS